MKYLTDTDLVLVAIMPNAADLEIARLLGWYRIPLKSAPKIIRPDYIAFYQTASFPKGHRSRIEAFAEVRGVELTTRAELFQNEPDHTRAHEEYYKIQLGELRFLDRPVLADEWKRFTFFYTTGAHLTGAETIRGLAMNACERTQVWKTLKERMENGASYGISDSDVMQLPEELIFLLGNMSLSGLELSAEGRVSKA